MDLNDGGARKCPAGDLNIAKACRIAKEALKLIKTEYKAFDSLLAKEFA
jgi:hypothetical protein